MTFDTPEFKRIAELYKRQRTNFDATLSAYGYYGKRDPDVFTYFVEEKKFLTPYMRSVIDARPPRRVNEQFENIYWTKRKEIKAFYDAGGGDLITLGTDHPSWASSSRRSRSTASSSRSRGLVFRTPPCFGSRRSTVPAPWDSATGLDRSRWASGRTSSSFAAIRSRTSVARVNRVS
jgi:hypothetical protein